MDTKKLRQKVLDLAIRGRLVPQDPNDEPASVLLDRIRAEKARLVGEGKIKKSYVENLKEYFYNLPEGWILTNVGELLINRDSERIPLSSEVRKKQNKKIYDYYGAAGVIDKVDHYLFNERLLLIGEDGANLLSRTKNNAFFAEGKFWVNNHAHVLDCSEKTVLEYVAFIINSMSLEDYITGSAQPKLTQDNLNKIPIPLPPLSEQRRIVRAVDELFEQIDIIERSEKELEEAADKTRSKLLDLAIRGRLVPQDPNEEPASALLERIRREKARLVQQGKLKKKDLEEKPISPDEIPFDLPEGWVWTCMYNCNIFISSHEDPSKNPQQLYELYSVPTFETGMPEFLKGKEISSSKQIVQKNDVLLCKINPHLNRSWVVSHYKEELPCIASSEWIVFRNNLIYPKYLKYCFTSPYFKNLMMSNVSGVGGSLMRAQPNSVAKYLFPLPPLAEQRRIVTKLEELLHEIDKLKG